MNLGERVRKGRQALGITQQELARGVGLTAQHISAIEQNKRVPSLNLIARMAEQLGVSIDFLVSGKEGIITDTIPAIKADKTLTLNVKKALIALVEELRRGGTQAR
jgi:transcriptional regulator with XRE-family HTH domain